MKRRHSTPRPEDEYCCTEDGAKVGGTYENTSETEPRGVLPCVGPDVNPDAPEMARIGRTSFEWNASAFLLNGKSPRLVSASCA